MDKNNDEIDPSRANFKTLVTTTNKQGSKDDRVIKVPLSVQLVNDDDQNDAMTSTMMKEEERSFYAKEKSTLKMAINPVEEGMIEAKQLVIAKACSSAIPDREPVSQLMSTQMLPTPETPVILKSTS